MVFVFGLCGLLVFPLLAPFAWFMGNEEIAAIDAGRRAPENRQLARAGQIMGIIMSALLIIFAVATFLLIGLAFARS
jgi:hypothetical protein